MHFLYVFLVLCTLTHKFELDQKFLGLVEVTVFDGGFDFDDHFLDFFVRFLPLIDAPTGAEKDRDTDDNKEYTDDEMIKKISRTIKINSCISSYYGTIRYWNK